MTAIVDPIPPSGWRYHLGSVLRIAALSHGLAATAFVWLYGLHAISGPAAGLLALPGPRGLLSLIYVLAAALTVFATTRIIGDLSTAVWNLGCRMRGQPEHQRTEKSRAVDALATFRPPSRPILFVAIWAIFLFASGLAPQWFPNEVDPVIRLRTFHMVAGAIFTAIAVMALLRQLRGRERPLRRALLLLLLFPAGYLWDLLACSPLNLTVLFFAVYIPAYLLVRILPRTESARRMEMTAGLLTVSLLVATLVSAIYASMNPNTIRFASVHRGIHSATALPLVGLALYWGWTRRAAKGIPAGYRRPSAVAVLTALAVAANWGLLQRRLDRPLAGDGPHVFVSSFQAIQDKQDVRTLPNPKLVNQSAVCGECHPIPYRQWLGSSHAQAVNRSFLTIFRNLETASGKPLVRMCFNCHAPDIALAADAATLAYDDERLRQSDGIGCIACHNVRHAGEQDGRYSMALTFADRIANPEKRKRYIATNVMQHAREMSPDPVKNGQVCQPCHRLQSIRNGKTLWPIDNVSSYETSPQAEVFRCHDCHMPRTELDEAQYSWQDHSFWGINMLLDKTALRDSPLDTEHISTFVTKTGQWLKGEVPLASLSQVFMDLQFKSYRAVSPRTTARFLQSMSALMKEPPLVAALDSIVCDSDRSLRVNGQIEGRHIAHNFPSSLFANIQQVWIQAQLLDADGQIVADSDPEGIATNWIGRVETLPDGTWIRPDQSLLYSDIEYRFVEPGKPYPASIPIVSRSPVAAGAYTAIFRLNYRRYESSHIENMAIESLPSAPITPLAEARKEFNGCPAAVQ